MSRLTKMIYCALFATLTVILAQIMLPLPFTPVMLSLATLAPLLAGILLGSGGGALAMAVYVALGVIGLPVFARFSGGIGIIAGPTGGYILSYAGMAAIAGWLSKGKMKFLPVFGAAAIASIFCHLCGLTWFMLTTGASLGSALLACTLPFLPGDLAKAALAALLGLRIAPALQRGR